MGAGASILLVEDHEDTITAFAAVLRSNGHTVAAVRTIREAVQLCTSGMKFDLLITDIWLPDGDGLALMSTIGVASGLRGIVISGCGLMEDIERSMKAGYATHLVKPVSVQQMIAAVKQSLAVPAINLTEKRSAQ